MKIQASAIVVAIDVLTAVAQHTGGPIHLRYTRDQQLEAANALLELLNKTQLAVKVAT